MNFGKSVATGLLARVMPETAAARPLGLMIVYWNSKIVNCRLSVDVARSGTEFLKYIQLRGGRGLLVIAL